MTTQSEGGGHGGRRGSPSVRISNLSALSGVTPSSAASHQSGGAGGHPSGSTSASQQARERYTSVVPASGSSSKVPSRATSAMGPTTSAPSSEGGTDDEDTEMRQQTPFPPSFMAEPTLLRLVGNYGVAEQDAEAIAAALLTATTWFQTTHSRPDVFADMFIAPKLRKRMAAFAQAAERHPIFQGERNIASMEVEMETIRLPPPPGPPMPALDAKMAPPPPLQRPVDRKGKAPVRTAPRPQPIKPVVAFQRPPPPINLASHPRKSFAAAVRNTKGPASSSPQQLSLQQAHHVPRHRESGDMSRALLHQDRLVVRSSYPSARG